MAFLNETGLSRYDGKLKNLMATAYSTSATYAVGDYCIHGGSLYRCTAAIESAESWTAAHWTKVNLGDEIDSAKEDIAKLKLDVADAFSASDAHAVGDYVVKDGVLYRCTTAIGSGGETWTPGHWTAVNIGDELVAVKADIGILKSDLADAYDSTATYEVGDYCLKDGVLYRCTTAISTAEAWTAGHWTAVQVGDDLSDLKGAINQNNNNLAITESGNTASRNYSVGAYVVVSGQLYKVISPISSGNTFTVGTNIESIHAVENVVGTVMMPTIVDTTHFELTSYDTQYMGLTSGFLFGSVTVKCIADSEANPTLVRFNNITKPAYGWQLGIIVDQDPWTKIPHGFARCYCVANASTNNKLVIDGIAMTAGQYCTIIIAMPVTRA